MININFLANKQSQKIKQRASDKKLFKISTYVLMGMVVLLIISLVGKLLINLRISGKDKEIEAFKESILAQEKVEIDYLIFVNKLETVGEIYEKRSDKQAAMNFFADLFSGIGEITGMTYDEEIGGLSLQLDHANVFKMEQSMNLLDSTKVTSVYKDVEKKTLSREAVGNYRLNLELRLKTNKDLGTFD